ncbi:hypothetical protein ANCCAN_03811 [Ancylostoma caninum]|uniref:UPAR/Ly6 domain-containing protein n=1 Tax=Ancylostoma caninum TaxID=29170 RepID=A0A368H0T8_ANCCA|nr:hypothetical protein ANCCAN_03811 [Ancylostoma caninum]
MLYKEEARKNMCPLLQMASRGIVFIFCCFLSVSTALRCYLGDQLFQGSMLLRESLSLTDCPNTRFCVRQEITSSDLKTVNYLCDQATDIHGNYVVACQSEGTHSSTTSNNFPSVNMCCSSDLCNLNASNSSNSPIHRLVMVLLLLLYSFLM